MADSEKINLHGFNFDMRQRTSGDEAPLVDLIPSRPLRPTLRRVGTASQLADMARLEAGHDYIPTRRLHTFVDGIGYLVREHGLPVGAIVTPIRKQG